MPTQNTFLSRQTQQDLNTRLDNLFRQVDACKIARNIRYAEVCHDEKTADSLRNQLKQVGLVAGMA